MTQKEEVYLKVNKASELIQSLMFALPDYEYNQRVREVLKEVEQLKKDYEQRKTKSTL